MVYDMTSDDAVCPNGPSGFAICNSLDCKNEYDIYTDDGHGNGDYICQVAEKYWAERIAIALDYNHE